MKKLLFLFFSLILLSACSNNTAKGAVDKYLRKYKTLDSEVLVDLEKIVDNENLNEKQKDKYKDILKKQYKDLTFNIIEEEYDDRVSYVTVKINVYDLYRANYESAIYLENNQNEFLDEEGNYDKDLFVNYRLDKMKNESNRVDYTITFTVTKNDGKYSVEQPTNDDLKKIHGIYNYELN